MGFFDLALTNLTSPAVLFFLLGIFAAAVRSDLSIPQQTAKAIALYLMMAIGFKGGAAVSEQGWSSTLGLTLIFSVVVASALPLIAYPLLRLMTRLSALDAAAVAGHYGSISVVTFVAATQALDQIGVRYEGFMVAAAAMMETPAIAIALLLARRHLKSETSTKTPVSQLLREVLFNGSIVILVGAFMIGIISGKAGLEQAKPFLVTPFKGVLMLFLLDMGLVAGRSVGQARRSISATVVLFGLVMPLIGGVIAAVGAPHVGLGVGGVALMITLCASASYIAVPAAMRIALPEANPAIYLTLSLGITFPFNLTVGIPIYIAMARFVAG
ncbi:MAG: sodium-dependent bicarbonate transport family permease [Myxococcota bacterium]